MENKTEHVSRPQFFERLATGAALAAAGGAIAANIAVPAALAAINSPDSSAEAAMNAGAFAMVLPPDAESTQANTPIVNPNILMIMVDQLRVPQYWLSAIPLSGPNQHTALDALTPNIAFLRQNSVQFQNFFIAAQACSPSRATLLNGLYAPQTD